MATYPPAPTYAPHLVTGKAGVVSFNPVWIDWFLKLSHIGAYPPPPTSVDLLQSDGKTFTPTWFDWLLRLPSSVHTGTYPPAPTFIALQDRTTNEQEPKLEPAWVDWFLHLV